MLYQTELKGLDLLQRGKVRDIYAIDDEYLLIVTTDRLSAFDVVLPDPIPGKGAVLTATSNFWFDRMSSLIPNHLAEIPLEQVITDSAEYEQIKDQAIVVKRLKPLAVEAIVRGYLIGSGWKDYQQSGSVCGIQLADGLRMADRLPEPIYTPSTKAEAGEHDQNIDYAYTCELLGEDLAQQVKTISLKLYTDAASYALERGIIIADTKFEFGIDQNDRLYLIDEVLTPDSSRFWPADQYQPGSSPPSFDKQFVRDYLESIDWNKQPPGPKLPQEIIDKTAEKYREALTRLVG